MFTDTKANADRIKQTVGEESWTKNRKYIIKQAEQIGHCIHQAEEYFQAANQVKLPTRPLLLYYGASSLGQALVLLKGNGEHSIDVLRSKKRHNHHGLILVGEPAAPSECNSPKSFLDSIKVRIFAKENLSTSGLQQEPWGAFPLYYAALASPTFVIAEDLYIGTYKATYFLPHPTCDMVPLESLLPRRFSVSELFSSLPDLISHLDWQPELCKGSQTVTARVKSADDPVGNVSCQYFLDNLNDTQKTDLISHYRQQIPTLRTTLIRGNGLVLEHSYATTDPPRFAPDIVDDIRGRLYYITNPAQYVAEPAGIYIVLYALGHLARYYPDKWMQLSSTPTSAALISAFLSVAQRKFPHLLLDQLERTKYVVTP